MLAARLGLAKALRGVGPRAEGALEKAAKSKQLSTSAPHGDGAAALRQAEQQAAKGPAVGGGGGKGKGGAQGGEPSPFILRSAAIAAAGALAVVALVDPEEYSSSNIHVKRHASDIFDKRGYPKRPVPTRSEQIQRMKQEEEFDLLIIGGGATGTGMAADAATRGLKTAMVEANDFASGTSSRSTKLAHGGVRYLEKAVKNFDYSQLHLVFEALSERKRLLGNGTL